MTTQSISPVRFTDVVRSEWTKLRSLRSTRYTLLAACVVAVLLGVMISTGLAGQFAEGEEIDPTTASRLNLIMVQPVIAVLGALVATSEYATGMIRTSLTAVPRRGRLLAAKTLVFSGVALVSCQVVAFASFFIGQAVLAGYGAPSVSLGDPEVLRAVIGAGLYLAMVGMMGVAVGMLVRATAGAFLIMVAVFLLVPAITPVLPEPVATIVGVYGPFGAGTQIMAVVQEPGLLSPWTGFGVLCIWVLAVLTAALVVFQRRDA
jgi:ABC-2 type transport system permease protein